MLGAQGGREHARRNPVPSPTTRSPSIEVHPVLMPPTVRALQVGVCGLVWLVVGQPLLGQTLAVSTGTRHDNKSIIRNLQRSVGCTSLPQPQPQEHGVVLGRSKTVWAAADLAAPLQVQCARRGGEKCGSDRGREQGASEQMAGGVADRCSMAHGSAVHGACSHGGWSPSVRVPGHQPTGVEAAGPKRRPTMPALCPPCPPSARLVPTSAVLQNFQTGSVRLTHRLHAKPAILDYMYTVHKLCLHDPWLFRADRGAENHQILRNPSAKNTVFLALRRT